MNAFLRLVFEKDLAVEADYNLADMVSKEVLPATPLALVSVTGYDASYTYATMRCSLLFP